jgi:hypothetical protein
MDRIEQVEEEFRLIKLLKKQEALLMKGCNDEKLNDKIRQLQSNRYARSKKCRKSKRVHSAMYVG